MRAVHRAKRVVDAAVWLALEDHAPAFDLDQLEAKRAPDRRLQTTGEQRLKLLQPVQQAFGLIHGGSPLLI